MKLRCLPAIIVLLTAGFAVGNELSVARQLLLTGRYEEATEQFAAAGNAVEPLLGITECQLQQGKLRPALQVLEAFAVEHGETPHSEIHAKAGQIHFALGAWQAAKYHVERSLQLQSNQPLARFVNAELLRVRGQFEQAATAYEALANQSTAGLSVEQAMWVGRAIAIHGRWQPDIRVFDRLVNEFYPQLIRRDPNFWPAHLEIARLFLEKYNEPEALRSVNAALAINPRCAEIHLALAWIALDRFDFEAAEKHLSNASELWPTDSAVLRGKADLALHNQQFELALQLLAKAERQCAWDEGTLGRKLAIFLRLDGVSQTPQGRVEKLARTVEARNPRNGEFYAAAAAAFEAMRIYPSAEKYYRLAIARSPEMVYERGKLGLVQMRLGEESAARETLEEAFRMDPFNVRVKNTLEVLDLLNRYSVIETQHFIIRFDRGHDELLAEYAARYLEETVFPDIVKSLGYQPTEKTLLEVFSRADGTTGHGWFSARMVGLPFIGTVGACAGKMFAMTSPADGKPFNWARVLRHEFVHVVNLQQTGFQIPHWFTEALAVRNEGVGYPTDWDAILAKYVASDQLFDLKDINHGFTRPGTSERWTLAYYQAYLYADYIAKNHGEVALVKLIEQYAAGASTPEALRKIVGQSLDEFEAGYRSFLADRARTFVGKRFENKSEEYWIQAAAVSPNDEVPAANMARLHLQSGRLREARRWAEKTLVINESNSLANRVMAELLFSVGEDTRAWDYAEAGLKAREPDPDLILLAGNRMLDAKKFDRAETYFQLGRRLQNQDPIWIRGLARVYLASGNDVELISVLSELAEREPDKVTMARKLSQLALRHGDFQAAQKWARRVIHVDVTNPLAHANLARAYAGQGKHAQAIREYQTALKLAPGEANWRAELEQLKK